MTSHVPTLLITATLILTLIRIGEVAVCRKNQTSLGRVKLFIHLVMTMIALVLTIKTTTP